MLSFSDIKSRLFRLKTLKIAAIALILVFSAWISLLMMSFRICDNQQKSAETRIAMCSIFAHSIINKTGQESDRIAYMIFNRGLAYSDFGDEKKAKDDFLEAMRWLNIAYDHRGPRRSRFIDEQIEEMLHLASLKGAKTENLWKQVLQSIKKNK